MADEQLLDPTFHLPTGVKDVKYKEPDQFEVFVDPDEVEETFDDSDEFSGADYDSGDDDVDGEGIYPPDYMEIVNQEVRTLPGGGQVVDITIELPDLEDGNKYDLRLTK